MKLNALTHYLPALLGRPATLHHREHQPASPMMICPSCLKGLPASWRVFDVGHTLNCKPMCAECIGQRAIAESRAKAPIQDGVPVSYGCPFEIDSTRLARLAGERGLHE